MPTQYPILNSAATNNDESSPQWEAFLLNPLAAWLWLAKRATARESNTSANGSTGREGLTIVTHQQKYHIINKAFLWRSNLTTATNFHTC